MDQRPNFIVIHTDQQRYDCVSAAGRRKGIYTPYIDTIAWQGAMFTSCYTTCPLCIPQRLSLLTGQTPQHHGLFANMGIPYLPLENTLPEQMRKGGYQTAMVGRTMHTYPASYSYGFEYYLPGDPSSEAKDTTDAFFKYLKDNNPSDCGGYEGCGPHNNSRVAAPFHLEDHYHQTKWATNRAIEFMENRDASRPFMLFVGYYAPHSPHNPPANYFNRYYGREDLDDPYISNWDVPPVNNGNAMSRYVDLKGEELRSVRAGYYGNIAFLDSQVGRLLTKAMSQGNTYIIFTSDHGELLGDHYLYQKNRPYEGAVHIPFMIMGPDIRDSQKIDKPVGWHDIMPTILDLAGLPVPDTVDGASMAPLLRGEETPWRDYIHGECTHDFMFTTKTKPESDRQNLFYEKGSQFLTDGKMKYIWHVTSGTEQLFDVERDYKEQNNLAAQPGYHEELGRWRSRMVKELEGRPEGFSDGEKLIAGCSPVRASEAMDGLAKKRQAEGFTLAFGRKKKPEADMGYENHLMN